ncbi:hypothetical protein ACJMK2_040018 [Sinanodonta woodiana]|uniref:Uncharacterized protein n=1 Tax=Sinanodonta woodiana TaxID=1069815 RepID=A0ABD3WDQ0_SINWO
MLDVLYKFNVIGNGLCAIGREISAVFGHIGSMRHACLFIWSIAIGFLEALRDGYRYQLGLSSVIIFAMSTLYLGLISVRPFRYMFYFKFLQVLATLVLRLSSIAVFIFYILLPLHRLTLLTLKLTTGKEFACLSMASIVLTLGVLLLINFFISILQRLCRRKLPKRRNRANMTPNQPLRRSARIQARSPNSTGTSQNANTSACQSTQPDTTIQP